MKKFILSFLLLLVVVCTYAQVSVKGYYRKNGTYVQPHIRSSPDGNPYNNYSYPGNTNPYTGKVATGNAETYLSNYYNRNKSYFVGDRVELNSNTKLPGSYLKCYVANNDTQAFYIYTSDNSMNGYIIVDASGNTKVYDKNSNYVNTYYITDLFPTSANRTESSVAQNNATKINPKRAYLKDKNGNFTGSYVILIYNDDTVNNYEFYNSLGELQGYISDFENGDRFIYDINKKLLDRVKATIKN